MRPANEDELNGAGYNPTPMYPPSCARPGSKVEEALTEYWGEQCSGYEEDCPVCEAWAEYKTMCRVIGGSRMNLKIGQQLTIWVVRGDDDNYRKLYFATKIEAEKAAREFYPHEDIPWRYARISYITTEPYTPE